MHADSAAGWAGQERWAMNKLGRRSAHATGAHEYVSGRGPLEWTDGRRGQIGRARAVDPQWARGSAVCGLWRARGVRPTLGQGGRLLICDVTALMLSAFRRIHRILCPKFLGLNFGKKNLHKNLAKREQGQKKQKKQSGRVAPAARRSPRARARAHAASHKRASAHARAIPLPERPLAHASPCARRPLQTLTSIRDRAQTE